MNRTGTVTRWYAHIALMTVAILGLSLISPNAAAQSPEEIQVQMEEHNRKIKALDEEIATYQKTLNVLGTQKQTLQSAIKTIDVSRQQTSTQISVTQNKIAATNLKIQELSGAISKKEYLIALNKTAVAESIREIANSDNVPLIEQLFSVQTLADAWEAVDMRAMVSAALRDKTNALSRDRQELSLKQKEEGSKKTELNVQRSELTTQRKTLDLQKAEKDRLLAETKNQESSYQALIAKKRAEQKVFESALSSLENGLQSVGSVGIPAVGSGILVWPFTATFMQGCPGKAGALGNKYCVTQYFGNTAFSTANPQVYNGSGHNAIDIGAPSGTPVTAALSATVMATGNTDAIPGCYSFGKWVMLKHANGLSTLYSHLSSIAVSPGQSVATGEVIGNSGMTGYATGPHLHFGVYATTGVQIMTLGAYRGATSPCANATMPVAPKDAYLNPMSYL